MDSSTDANTLSLFVTIEGIEIDPVLQPLFGALIMRRAFTESPWALLDYDDARCCGVSTKMMLDHDTSITRSYAPVHYKQKTKNGTQHARASTKTPTEIN